MCPPPKTGSFPIRAGLWSLFLMVMRGGARGRGAVPAGSLRLSVALSLSLSLPSSPSLPRSLSALSSPLPLSQSRSRLWAAGRGSPQSRQSPQPRCGENTAGRAGGAGIGCRVGGWDPLVKDGVPSSPSGKPSPLVLSRSPSLGDLRGTDWEVS